MERKVLGRGLEALIPTEVQGSRERVQTLRVSQVKPSRFQPRIQFSKDRLEELASSIREKGVIQPIIVRTIDNENFELIAGERRLRAVKHLGLEEIPAIVRRVPDSEVLELSIIENIQREELNTLEEAKAYKRLAEEFGLTQDSIAQKVGKDKSSVSNLLRILNLPEKVQNYLSQNFISFGHAKVLLSLTDTQEQLQVCETVIKKGLSVRQLEFSITAKRSRFKERRAPAAQGDIHLKNLEEKLQHKLGTKVRIQHGKKRGKIEIDYYSVEDLERVLKLLSTW